MPIRLARTCSGKKAAHWPARRCADDPNDQFDVLTKFGEAVPLPYDVAGCPCAENRPDHAQG